MIMSINIKINIIQRVAFFILVIDRTFRRRGGGRDGRYECQIAAVAAVVVVIAVVSWTRVIGLGRG
jgi:hypothetical protein